MWKVPAHCRGLLGQDPGRPPRLTRPTPVPTPPPPLLRPLTVVVQQQLSSREQLGPMLWVHDIQLVEVCFPQLFEVLQRLVAIEQQGGRVLLWAEAGHQRGRLQATPTYDLSLPAELTCPGPQPLLLDTRLGPSSNLKADALQQLMQSLGLGPLALALSAAGAGRSHSLLGQHIHVDELERAQPAIEQAQPRAHRRLFDDLDHISLLWEESRAEQSGGEVAPWPPVPSTCMGYSLPGSAGAWMPTLPAVSVSRGHTGWE